MTYSGFRKILICNRGEIAVRIIRTCRELDISTAVVYSDADASALHVRMADEAFRIGPAPSVESYLRQLRILEVASQAGADAVHPGYGFLSENADFAVACAEKGITFIGPSADAIRLMGDKISARALMREARVPVVPGSDKPLVTADEAMDAAEGIGFPVLIKAAAGGGGKGIRAVRDPKELHTAVRAAGNEARAAFGDGRVYIEKLIDRPRHIEVQVLGDRHGHVVHLFERECSIQRRHQKVIEEAPSSFISDETRQKMGDAAVRAARAVGYGNAGTIEFLVDSDERYYFMEMNTRLQVEHPVTELITGIDLVAEQIRVAEGRRLPFSQGDLAFAGHAIECRIYAEDPANEFLPDSGRLLRHAPPAGPGIRLDSGVEEGEEVSVHYDPMIAKLCVWAPDRRQAIARMRRALREYEIAGVATTIPFCSFTMEHHAFANGDYGTDFVETHFRDRQAGASGSDSRVAALAAALFAAQDGQVSDSFSRDGETSGLPRSAWIRRREFREK